METTKRTLTLIVLTGVVLWLAYLARAVMTPLLAALLLAYVLHPVVRWLEGRGLSRPMASGLVVAVSGLLLATATFFAAQRLFFEAEGFYGDVVGEPRAFTDTREAAVEELLPEGAGAQEAQDLALSLLPSSWRGETLFFQDVNEDGLFDPGYALVGIARIEELLARHADEQALDGVMEGLQTLGPKLAEVAGDAVQGTVRHGVDAAGTVLGVLTLLILFPIYLYYSLVNLEWLYDVTVTHLPAAHRPLIVQLLGRVHVTVSAFFRGRMIVMLLKGVMLLALFLVFGTPFALVCATFAALAALVPVVGGIAAMVPPLLLTLAADGDMGTMVGLTAGLVVVELVEGYILIPGMIGKQVGLHPLTVLVSTFVAGSLLGLFGMLLAIPLAAVLKILFGELVLPEIRRRAALEGAPPEDSPEFETMAIAEPLALDPSTQDVASPEDSSSPGGEPS